MEKELSVKMGALSLVLIVALGLFGMGMASEPPPECACTVTSGVVASPGACPVAYPDDWLNRQIAKDCCQSKSVCGGASNVQTEY